MLVLSGSMNEEKDGQVNKHTQTHRQNGWMDKKWVCLYC